jgi:hypothetical protein
MDMSHVMRCTAAAKSTEAPCTAYAVKDSEPPRCRYHLGRPTALVKAEAKALQLASRLDPTPVDNPLEALAQIAGEAIAVKDALRGAITRLTTLETDRPGGLRAEVALYERALDRAGRIVVDMAKLKIDDRLTHISEVQARHFQTAFEVTLTDLGLTPDVKAQARTVMARHLTGLL